MSKMQELIEELYNENMLRKHYRKWLEAGKPRRYDYTDIFKYYNLHFKKNETSPRCPSCIAKVIKKIEEWINKKKD